MNEFVANAGVNTILMGAVVWILQKLFLNNLQKKLKDHQKKIEIDLAKVKSDLDLVVAKHNTKYSLLQHRRIEVIENIYNLLINVRTAFNGLVRETTEIMKEVTPDGTVEKKNESYALGVSKINKELIRMMDEMHSLRFEFDRKKFFFSIGLCKKIDSYLASLINPLDEFFKDLPTDKPPVEVYLCYVKVVQCFLKQAMSNVYDDALQSIENEIRTLLGTDNE